MEITSEIKFANEFVKKSYLKLNLDISEENLLKSYIDIALKNIQKNAFCSIQIPKRLIPNVYLSKFGRLDNLWKYNLPKGWRLIYTIKSDGSSVFAIILEWLSHKEYEKRFSY